MLKIFEQPWSLLIVAAFALIVILIIRKIVPDKQHWWQLLLPILIATAAFGLDFLVQTDTEQIKTIIKRAAKAIEHEDVDAFKLTISEDYYDSYHRSKKALIIHCRARLSEPLIEKNIARLVSIDLSNPNATVVFTVRVLFDKQSLVYQNFKRLMLVKVRFELQKQRNNKWLINRAEILEIDRQPAKWKNIR